MKLNHLNLTVSEVPAAREFLIEYFGLRPIRDAPQGPAMGFLFDDNDMVLTLIRSSRSEPVKYPGSFHIGFIQPSEERVNEINRQLRAGGYDVPPPSRQHGSWTFYFEAPGGFTIEVLS